MGKFNAIHLLESRLAALPADGQLPLLGHQYALAWKAIFTSSTP